MRGHSLRSALMGATIAIVAIVAPAPRVDAATATGCTRTSGVTVIVDFAAFNRDIARGCASGTPATALAAMHTAGFTTAGTTRYGDAFLCRIDNLPSPKVEACSDTPAAKSSWSFYWARPTDAAWTYSRVGVLSYRPPPGTIVAFAFGDLAKPGVLPSTAIPVTRATVTTTAPTTLPATTTPPDPVVAPAVVTTTPPVVAPTTAAPTAPPPTTTHTTTPRTTGSSTSTSTTVAARIDDRVAVAKVPGSADSGSPVPALIGTALVIALGAGGALVVRARRRRAA